MAGLLVVGSSLAPVVPVAYSLAGRAAPHHGARTVALVTTVGYSAFIVGPFSSAASAAAPRSAPRSSC